MPASPLTPVTLLTGLSGSGKTTLLERAQREPGFANVAVVACASPAALNWSAAGDAPELASRCLCCSTNDELIGVMREMYFQRAAGTRPFFQRVVIEANGHTDPQRITDMLAALPLASVKYALDGIVTVVDAERAVIDAHGGEDALDGNIAARRQIEAADCLVVSKTDHVTSAGYQAVEQLLAGLNPRAARFNAQGSAFNPANLFIKSLRSAQAKAA